jgi:hypothetical protein
MIFQSSMGLRKSRCDVPNQWYHRRMGLTLGIPRFYIFQGERLWDDYIIFYNPRWQCKIKHGQQVSYVESVFL